MSYEENYSFIVNARDNAYLVFVTSDPKDELRAMELTKQLACCIVVDDQITIVDDVYNIFAKRKIKKAVIKAVKKSEAKRTDCWCIQYIPSIILNRYVNNNC